MAESVVLAERCVVFCAVVAAAVVDLRTRTIPNLCSVTIVLVRCVAVAVLPLAGDDAGGLLCASLAGAFAAGLPLVLAALVTDGVGGGDVKLFAALGFALGWQAALVLLFLSCVFTVGAGLASYVVNRCRDIQTRLLGTTVPMAPQIALALMVTYWLFPM